MKLPLAFVAFLMLMLFFLGITEVKEHQTNQMLDSVYEIAPQLYYTKPDAIVFSDITSDGDINYRHLYAKVFLAHAGGKIDTVLVRFFTKEKKPPPDSDGRTGNATMSNICGKPETSWRSTRIGKRQYRQ